jgi:proteasome component ECM29
MCPDLSEVPVSTSQPPLSPFVQVLEMLSHINKRVKEQRHIQLPLQELLALYGDAQTPMMVKNFAIVYIEMAFERSTLEEKLAVIARMLEGIALRPVQHQDILLRMVAKVSHRQ